MSLVITVNTSNGEYQLWKPKGQTGVKHMGILLRFSRIAKDATETGMDLLDDDRVLELYEEWCTKVLPNIILKSPFNSFDDIPFDDQFVIFIKMMEASNLNIDLGGDEESSFQEG